MTPSKAWSSWTSPSSVGGTRSSPSGCWSTLQIPRTNVSEDQALLFAGSMVTKRVPASSCPLMWKIQVATSSNHERSNSINNMLFAIHLKVSTVIFHLVRMQCLQIAPLWGAPHLGTGWNWIWIGIPILSTWKWWKNITILFSPFRWVFSPFQKLKFCKNLQNFANVCKIYNFLQNLQMFVKNCKELATWYNSMVFCSSMLWIGRPLGARHMEPSKRKFVFCIEAFPAVRHH